jgi:hypothetical protein
MTDVMRPRGDLAVVIAAWLSGVLPPAAQISKAEVFTAWEIPEAVRGGARGRDRRSGLSRAVIQPVGERTECFDDAG